MAGRTHQNTICSIYDLCSAQHEPAFVVVAVRFKGHWVFIKRKDTELFECPGGRVRTGEPPLITARRILYEQTGITAGKLYPVCNYSLSTIQTFKSHGPRKEVYGRLYYVEALCKTALPDFEVECTREDGWIPGEKEWNHPLVQKPLFRKVSTWLEDVKEHGTQEQDTFFFEKVCGIVPYCVKDGVRHYLTIQNLSGHIGFPKGHTENGETETETARREALEEAGVQVETLPGFRFCFSYRAQEHALHIHKYAVYFIGEFSLEQAVQIQAQPEEILNWWLRPYEETLEMLNKPNDKALLTRAEEFLSNKDSE